MEALEFLKTRNRMCKCGCGTCPANAKNNGYNVGCTSLMKYKPEHLIEIVELWGKNHPLITRAEMLKELFPNTSLTLCPAAFEGMPVEECGCSSKDCDDCQKEYWGGEYIR